MQYERTDIILLTELYDECVDFYSHALELPVLFSLDNEHSKLTCCDMGAGNYLMIETGGTAMSAGKPPDRSPVKLRFNVHDVEESARLLRDKGVAITVHDRPWGTVAEFVDPDGNSCSLRDEGSLLQ